MKTKRKDVSSAGPTVAQPLPAAGRPTLRDIYAARQRIAGVVRRTPLDRSDWLSERAGHDVYLKLECWQRTGSFKARGAYNAISGLSSEARARGLVTASAGNHGQAVALAARALGAHATVFVPNTAPEIKKNRIQALGAVLRTDASTYDEAEDVASRFAQETGATLVHGFADEAVVAGQGTVGLEILEELPGVRDVVVPVGGGGLIAGVGIALKSAGGDVRILGAQSTETTAMFDSFRAGRAVDCRISPTLADGLAGRTDEVSYQRTRLVADDIVLVPEATLAAAIRALYRYDGVIAEGAAAVAVAALVERVIEVRGPAVLVITGGNIDAQRFAGILSSE
ncbi:MAG TPA: pyridoxal-phosphate dependent enzyme [Longimicrobiales bacterium]|nr:pyridoxal-phosphate dependent enzyme [Longimicrobiales bacterium]